MRQSEWQRVKENMIGAEEKVCSEFSSKFKFQGLYLIDNTVSQKTEKVISFPSKFVIDLTDGLHYEALIGC